MHQKLSLLLALVVLTGFTPSDAVSTSPDGKPANLDTPRAFPDIGSKADWQKRAEEIREHVAVSCGLWPMPDKSPLKAEVFGKIEREGYTIEKVHLQTFPGFYLSGNLYRPLGRKDGPFPGILNPHGHWNNGRMADAESGSIAARCISFARQGAVAFSYDMVGYNDTTQVSHKFAASLTNQLWGISLMGLQTWNSIRALDFIASLPDVDKNRLACTGESGGGTQTFMLGALDKRLAVQAPIVMVSHTMQGGCLCENAPGLRVDYSNMEIAAAPAPRPQILVGATGDWTRATMTVEGPSIAKVYQEFNASDYFAYTIFKFDHNYNKTSREAVYEFFGRHLFNHPRPASLKEQPYKKEPDADLRVFPDGKLPADAKNEAQVIEHLVKQSKALLQAHLPSDKRTLERFRKAYHILWTHAFQLQGTPAAPAPLETPIPREARKIVVLLQESGSIGTLGESLRKSNIPTVKVDAPPTRNYILSANYFTTYNRTDAQWVLKQVKEKVVTLRTSHPQAKIVLAGQGKAGLWALMAAPFGDAVLADAAQLDLSTDESLLSKEFFVPGFRQLGAFEGTALLSAPNPIMLHNTGSKFPTLLLIESYRKLGAAKNLRTNTTPISDDVALAWIRELKIQ